MALIETLFGFEGRVRRSTWWMVRIAWIAFVVATFAAIGLNPGHPPSESSPFWITATVIFLAGLAVFLWIDLAVTTKRFHDRNKSGWMILVTFIPLIGGFWILAECGILDGTRGPNRFGASPKGHPGPQVAAFS